MLAVICVKHPRNDKGQIFSHIRQKWLAETPEERVQQSFVVTLHNEYGFALEQMDEELPVAGRGSARARADLVIWRTHRKNLFTAEWLDSRIGENPLQELFRQTKEAYREDGNWYTQKQIAEETGKSEGEISKLLSLLTLAPNVQHIARGDSTGRITKRHLYAIVKLPNPDQARLIEKAITDHLTATALEELVEANRRHKATVRKSGSTLQRIRFNTSAATVTIIFRKKNVTDADIAAALDEATARAEIRARGHPGSPAISRCL